MTPPPQPPANAGLCAGCRHQRVVTTRRGPAYSLCERSRTDERFPRYPRLPVTSCPGHEPRAPGEAMGGPASR